MCPRGSREFRQRSELQEGLWTGAMHIKLPCCQGWSDGKTHEGWYLKQNRHLVEKGIKIEGQPDV